MPVAAPGIKVAAVKRLGGEVQLVGQSYSETEAFAQARPPQALFPKGAVSVLALLGASAHVQPASIRLFCTSIRFVTLPLCPVPMQF